MHGSITNEHDIDCAFVSSFNVYICSRLRFDDSWRCFKKGGLFVVGIGAVELRSIWKEDQARINL